VTKGNREEGKGREEMEKEKKGGKEQIGERTLKFWFCSFEGNTSMQSITVDNVLHIFQIRKLRFTQIE